VSAKAIICDWNGTIIEGKDEKPILESIAAALFKSSFPWHPFRMAHILRTKGELEEWYREGYRDDEVDFVIEMFRIYNEKIVKGLPVSFLHRAVERYATRKEGPGRLDYRVLRTVSECHQDGWLTGILSAGFRYGIQRILENVDCRRCFDFCEANVLKEEEGKALGFDLDIYRNKPQHLQRLLRERNIDERRVVYLGDSEDDAGCFEIAGHPVVAFLAPEGMKEKYAREYGAFVPRDEEDLLKYLRSL